MQHPLRSLTDVDWDDLEEIQHTTSAALHALIEQPAVVLDTLAELPDRPDLLELCEHYDILDKIVLYDDAGIRVRLHVFLPGYFDRPHNHRWSYSTLILRGSYRHYLYGTDENLDQGMDPATLKPLLVRHETPGSSYTLHHSMVHAVVAEPFTVSLVLRGPAQKDKFLVMDRHTGTSWWQYGASDETPEQAQAKRMSRSHLTETIRNLTEWDLFSDPAR